MHSYSTHLFNTFPDLHTVQERFQSKSGMDLINALFRPMVEKHHLEAKLGVGLLHRHFELRGNEKLVEFNNISLPWSSQAGDNHSGGKIIPNAWAVCDGKIIPYEFYFSPLGHDHSFDFDQVTAFLTEFVQAIEERGLDKIIAIRLFPHEGFTGALELTEGRANINLSPNQVCVALSYLHAQLTCPQVAKDGWNNATETMWFFEPEYMKQKRVCKCSGPSTHMHFHHN